MSPNTKTALIVVSATTNQTLPENAVAVLGAVEFTATAGEGTALTPTSGTPAAGQIQFTGSPHAPANTVTLNAAPTAGIVLLVTYVPVGGLGAAA